MVMFSFKVFSNSKLVFFIKNVKTTLTNHTDIGAEWDDVYNFTWTYLKRSFFIDFSFSQARNRTIIMPYE